MQDIDKELWVAEYCLGQRCVIQNCKLVDSRENVLIQMADMVAGSIRRSYDDSVKDSKIYKEIIQKHITDEWRFK
jgi:hypothetical protein